MKEAKYGKCAVNVVNILLNVDRILTEAEIKDIWLDQMSKLTTSVESIKKGCPRMTLTGLILNNQTIIKCKGNHSFQSKNYDYVRFILENQLNIKSQILKTDKSKFWKLIQDEFSKAPKNQNGQLDVLLALHKNKLLRI